MGTVSASSVEAAARPPKRLPVPSVSQWSAFVSFGAVLSMIFTGRLRAGEYLLGWDLGIDQLLFADSPQQAIRSAGLGLMAAVNALSFLVPGLALIVLSWTTLREAWPGQALSFAACRREDPLARR